MTRFCRRLSIFLFTFLLSTPLFAFDRTAPTDDELIRTADAIVLGHVISHRSFKGEDGILRTEFNIGVDEMLKGDPSQRYVRVTELGGIVNGRGAFTNAAANYLDGERVLVFMQRTGESQWRTLRASLGKFSLGVNQAGTKRLVRRNSLGLAMDGTLFGRQVENAVRDADDFLDYIRQSLRGFPPAPRYTTSESRGDVRIWPLDSYGPVDYTRIWTCCDDNGNPIGIRWPDFDQGRSVTMLTNGTQPGFDGLGAADRALMAWNSDAGSNVSYRRGGTSTAGLSDEEPDGTSVIIFNSPDTRGYLVYTWFWIDTNSPLSFAGYTFFPLTEFDIAFADGYGSFQGETQLKLDESLTMGMGFGLGLRFADEEGRTPQGTEQTSVLHNPIISTDPENPAADFGASIGSYDREALAAVYPSGGASVDPAIRSFSASPTQIRAGQAATLFWATSNAASVSISPTVGAVATSGSANVSPSSSTTYTMTATGLAKDFSPQATTVQKTVRVEVLQSPEVIVTRVPKQMVQGSNAGGATTSFAVQNVGGQSTTVNFSKSGTFFSIDTTSSSLAAGETKVVGITGQSVVAGEYRGTVSMSGSGVKSGTSVPVTLLAAPTPTGETKAKAEVTRIDVAAAVGSNPNGTAQFTNTGSATITGVLVSDVPWIIPQSGLITVNPGQTITVSFTIDRSKIPAGSQALGSRQGSLQLVFRTGSSGKTGEMEPQDGVASQVTNVLVVDTTTPQTSSGNPDAIGIAEVAMFAPGVGHAQGSTGLFISDFSATYLGASGSLGALDLFFTPQCPIPCTGTDIQSAVASSISGITAGTPVALADVVSNVYDTTGLGSLQVRGASPSEVALNAGILNVSDPLGHFGSTVPILRSDRSAGPGEAIYVTGLRKTATGHTNVFIQETGGGTATVKTEYFNANGDSLGSRTDPIASFRMIGFFDGPGRPISQGGTPDGAVSVVISNDITSVGKISAFATPVDRSSATGGDFWALADWNRQLGLTGTTPMLVPVAGAAAGANDTFFQTDVFAMNIGTTTATATLKYVYNNFDTGQNGLTKTVDISVNAGDTLPLENIVTNRLAVTGRTIGYLMFTPTAGNFSVTSRTYTTQQGKTATLGTGVTTLPLSGGLRLGEVRRLGAVDASSQESINNRVPGTARTNFALIETSGVSSVTVRVTVYYDIVSSSLAVARGRSSKDYVLSPGEYRQMSKIDEEIIGPFRQTNLGDLRNMQVEFLVIAGDGQASAWVSSVDNGTGDSNTRTE